MKNRVIWLIMSLLIVVSLVLASCTTTAEEEEEEEGVVEEEEEEEGPPVAGNWWDKFGEPEYGGTINYWYGYTPANFDQGLDFRDTAWMLWCEHLFVPDRMLDPEEYPFFSTQWIPDEYWQPNLAESWEQTDPQTVIVHLRQGVHWQDKPPVNGREFTAYDVQYHYDRMFGTGSGFTEPNPFYFSIFGALFEKVTASDKYTAVFEFKSPSPVFSFWGVLEGGIQYFEAREWVEQGDTTNWKNVVGTGAFMLTEYLSGSSMTFTKNPNYWAYDERYPQNRLPYADRFKLIAIADSSTALAAMRTGKIDHIADLSLAKAQNLANTDPEIHQARMGGTSPILVYRVDHEPFTDITVRKALQLAIDREAIAKSYYLGSVEAKPAGIMNPGFVGWRIPYDEWPQELRDEYSYNPELARELLAEAGYPEGFKTDAISPQTMDVSLLEVFQSYLSDIGVDMEITLMDKSAAYSVAREGKFDQIYVAMSTSSAALPPVRAFDEWTTTGVNNYTHHNDLAYDEIVEKFKNSNSLDEAKQFAIEADMHFLRQHWRLEMFPTYNYVAWQPWLKGYSGELVHGERVAFAPRWWIDQDLKKSMGY